MPQKTPTPVQRVLSDRNRQRARRMAGRVARSASGGLKRPCLYMHVPKCGGTSVSEALYATVPLHKRIGIVDTPSIRRALAMRNLQQDDPVAFHDEGEHAAEIARMREEVTLMYVAQNASLIHGHLLMTEPVFRFAQPRYGLITILRDPVARTISNYRMAHANGVFGGDFDAFLDSDMGRRMALHVLRFFSGNATVAPEGEAAALDIARERMQAFSVIGFLEDLDGFCTRFADVFGVRPSIPHYNRASGSELALTGDQRSRLEALCAPDIQLTDFARSLG